MADRQETLAHFVALTGTDEATALGLLEVADWNLEQAVELHFHSVGADDPPPPVAAGAGTSSRPPATTYQSDEELARSLAAEGAGGGLPQEDDVRAPLPTRTERLYGDSPGPGGYVPGMIDRAMRGLSQSRSHHINTFQDFRAAAEAAASEGAGSSAARAEEGLLAAAGASGTAAAGSSRGAAGGSPPNPGLSDLFRPPQDILFAGDFEMAKHKAGKDGKWLLVNVQSPTEFASHQLNRDTWGNTLVKDLIKGQFVLWQINYDTPDGLKVSNYYNLNNQYPAVLIIDSITGAKIWHRSGYIEAEKLLEELVPFMDHGPQDSGAAMLAQTSLKRRHAQMARGAASTSTAAAPAPAALSEDEELARAIAMSMQDQAGGGKQDEDEVFEDAYEGSDEDDAMLEAAIAQSNEQPAAPAVPAVDPVAVAAKAREEASARLPAEPSDGPASCRVAIRCPDGTRKQRRFIKTDPVQALLDYCILEVEEAASGRPFRLVPTYPGGVPLSNPAESLQQAGAANAMLALQWVD